MKTRIIQREPNPEQPDASAGDATQPPPLLPTTSRPAWPLERPAPQEGDLGLARVRPRRVRGRENAVGTKDISDVDQFSGESAPCRGGAGPRRPAAGRGGRVRPERQAHGQGPGSSGPRSHDVTGRLSGLQYVENVQVAAGRRRRRLGRRARRPGQLRHRRRLDRGARTGSIPASPRSPRCRSAIPASTSSSSAARAPHKAINEVISDDLEKAGELSLPVTLIILTLTFGTLVAAGVPLLIGHHRRDRRARPGRAPERDPARSTPTCRRSSC